MEKELKNQRSKSEKRADRWEWLWFFGDILLFLPRVFARLIRWIVDLF